MALLSLMLNCNPNNTHPISRRIKPPPFFSQISRLNTSFHLHYPPTNTGKKTHFNSAGYRYLSTPNTPKDKGNEEKDSDQVDVLKKWRSFLPGGSWWNLLHDPCNQEDESSGIPVKPFTVLCVFRRMWELVVVNDDDKWFAYVAFVSLTIAALLEVSVPSLLAASIFSAGRGDHMVFCKNVRVLTVLCITSGICSGLRSGCFAVINTNLLKHMREKLYSALIFQDIPFFDKETVGGLSSRLGADCQRLSNVVENDVNLILRYVIQGMGASLNLVILSWPLALSTLVICSILSAIFLLYGQYQKEAAKVTQDIIARANEVSHETFSLIRTVRACGMERHEFERYKWWMDKLAFISMRESAAYGIWNLSFNSLYRFTQVFAILLGGMSILTGHTTPEQLTKYVFYCEWLIYAAWRVQDNLSSLLQSIGASEKVLQLMDLLPGDQFLSKGVKLQKLMGYIEFVNVSFNYPSRVSILEHVTISVKASEVVAIAGLSGSGKSTLVNLLLRLYEPNEGQILIDSVPLKELDIRFLRENIGYVGQEPQLFHMDIKSNIMYGCPAHITHEDVERAAKQAYAHDFILSLPNGYETVVDDELLSGGQKQRIAIARAILRDPAILILDEATSALDADSEYNIKGILHGLRNGRKEKRTVIVIAHRLSTIRAADQIIVMKDGRVVEMGNHMELLNQNGLYARLNGLEKDVLAS